MALLELTGISKSFGGVQALRGVDFTVLAGQIHGLAGENGAGKSTLMKIIAGVHGADSGEFRVEGQPVHFRSAREARARATPQSGSPSGPPHPLMGDEHPRQRPTPRQPSNQP